MTEEQINIAIAESLGWRRVKTDIEVFVFPPNSKSGIGYLTKDLNHPRILGFLPNYAGDLNATNEMENALTDPGDFCAYAEELCKVVSRRKTDGPTYASVSATARQRAEAYLRTIGKWVQS